METARLIVEIALVLVALIVGGGVIAVQVWMVFRLRDAVVCIGTLTGIVEAVIRSNVKVDESSEAMVKAVAKFETTVSEDLKAVKLAQEGIIRAAIKNVVGVEALAKVVQAFSKSLLDASAGKKPENYDVHPDIEGLSKEQIEAREAADFVRVYNTQAPEIIST